MSKTTAVNKVNAALLNLVKVQIDTQVTIQQVMGQLNPSSNSDQDALKTFIAFYNKIAPIHFNYIKTYPVNYDSGLQINAANHLVISDSNNLASYYKMDEPAQYIFNELPNIRNFTTKHKDAPEQTKALQKKMDEIIKKKNSGTVAINYDFNLAGYDKLFSKPIGGFAESINEHDVYGDPCAVKTLEGILSEFIESAEAKETKNRINGMIASLDEMLANAAAGSITRNPDFDGDAPSSPNSVFAEAARVNRVLITKYFQDIISQSTNPLIESLKVADLMKIATHDDVMELLLRLFPEMDRISGRDDAYWIAYDGDLHALPVISDVIDTALEITDACRLSAIAYIDYEMCPRSNLYRNVQKAHEKLLAIDRPNVGPEHYVVYICH